MILERALGLLGRVEKERSLWLYKNTRIHLDRVVGLGEYLELEIVLAGLSNERRMSENEEMIALLNLERERFIHVPCLELL